MLVYQKEENLLSDPPIIRGNTVSFSKKIFDREEIPKLRFRALSFVRANSPLRSGAETRSAIVSGIVTMEAPVSY